MRNKPSAVLGMILVSVFLLWPSAASAGDLIYYQDIFYPEQTDSGKTRASGRGFEDLLIEYRFIFPAEPDDLPMDRHFRNNDVTAQADVYFKRKSGSKKLSGGEAKATENTAVEYVKVKEMDFFLLNGEKLSALYYPAGGDADTPIELPLVMDLRQGGVFGIRAHLNINGAYNQLTARIRFDVYTDRGSGMTAIRAYEDAVSLEKHTRMHTQFSLWWKRHYGHIRFGWIANLFLALSLAAYPLYLLANFIQRKRTP